jgi:predicted outer membrane repeat protein
LIGTTPSGCDFDDTVSGNTATLSGGAVVCTGSGAGGAEAQSTFDNFTWVLGASGTTATVSQTGSQISTGAAGECSCQMVISLVATRQ